MMVGLGAVDGAVLVGVVLADAARDEEEYRQSSEDPGHGDSGGEAGYDEQDGSDYVEYD